MTEQEWIDFVIANNNMNFLPIEIYLENKSDDFRESKKEKELKLQAKIKKYLINFTKKNIQVLNYLYDIGFVIVDELFDDQFQKNIKIKKLQKVFDNYVMFVNIDYDSKLNGVVYLQLDVKEKTGIYGYVFDKPTIEDIESALNEIKEKYNKRYFIKTLV